jgi:nucleoside-diphosphate-sugar epimerase
MKVALTGAAGFVGRHVFRALQAAGHEVQGTDLPGVCADLMLALDLRDRPAVIGTLDRGRPDLVIHAGAISGAMLALDDPALMFDVNVNGTLSVLEAMRRVGVPRLIHLSSNAVYRSRDDREPVDEEAALGDEPYGASKVAAEALVVAYAATAGIDVWMLRISSIYGSGRQTPYLISALAQASRSGEVMQVTDSRSNMRQFVHIEDVVTAIMATLQRPAQGCVALNLTGGDYLSEQAIALLVQVHRPDLRFEVVADKGEHGDGRKGPLNLARAAARLDWRPMVPIESGLAGLLQAEAAFR